MVKKILLNGFWRMAQIRNRMHQTGTHLEISAGLCLIYSVAAFAGCPERLHCQRLSTEIKAYLPRIDAEQHRFML
jgi:hypothetical protein